MIRSGLYWNNIDEKFSDELDRQIGSLDGIEKSLATMSNLERVSIFFEKTKAFCLPLIANSIDCLRDIKSDPRL